MRRILLVIPHFCAKGAGSGLYGSTSGAGDLRASILDRVIGGLHSSLGSRQAFLLWLEQYVPGKANGRVIHANEAFRSQIDVVICTTGVDHVVGDLKSPKELFVHRPVAAEPMMLGFACHEVLRAELGSYDWYCFLEDDLLISDPLFFSKLEWFVKTFGQETTLSPHRFERSVREPVHKLYHDGSVRPDFTVAWQDVTDLQYLRSELMGSPVQFERWPNPHSGCFFLTARQMEQWVSKPWFLDGDSSFAGPLESAASLGIIKTFRQYKASPSNAGFLELEHLHPRYLGEALKFS